MTVRPVALFSIALGLVLASPAAGQGTPAPEAATHDPPYGLALDSREPGRIQLVWVPAEDNRRVTVRAYHVWRREGAGAWVQVASLAPTATYYTDRTLTAGAAYSYRVVSEADATTGPALPIEQARRQSEPIGPVLALEPWYVSVDRVAPEGGPQGPGGFAWLRVHRWLDEAAAWETSSPFSVATGAAIGREDLAGDFRTGATLDAVWETLDAGDTIGWVRYTPSDGAAHVELSTRDAPPEGVWAEAPKQRRRRAPPEIEETTRERERPVADAPSAGPSSTPRFPEPTKLESVMGTKVLWEVENKTPYPLSVYYEGPTTGRTTVPAGEMVTIRLIRGGDYTVRGRVSSSDQVKPVTGTFSLLGGQRYRSTFVVQAAPTR